MQNLQQIKKCILNVLRRFESEFAMQIESLEQLSSETEFDVFFIDLCELLAKTHKELLAEIHMCLNNYGPADEIKNY